MALPRRADDSLANPATEEALHLLCAAARRLDGILHDECFQIETPLEVQAEIDSASKTINQVVRLLAPRAVMRKRSTKVSPSAPTRQQGQFLAFIREFMLRSYNGIAPTHTEFQRFFNLTPPSVNSMLIRLEERGFIRRIPGKARAIELTIDPELIPPLERPFKF